MANHSLLCTLLLWLYRVASLHHHSYICCLKVYGDLSCHQLGCFLLLVCLLYHLSIHWCAWTWDACSFHRSNYLFHEIFCSSGWQVGSNNLKKDQHGESLPNGGWSISFGFGGTTSVGKFTETLAPTDSAGLVVASFSVSNSLFSSWSRQVDKLVGVGVATLFNVEEGYEVCNEEIDEEELIKDEINVVDVGSFLFIPAVAPSSAHAATDGEALSISSQVGMINCLPEYPGSGRIAELLAALLVFCGQSPASWCYYSPRRAPCEPLCIAVNRQCHALECNRLSECVLSWSVVILFVSSASNQGCCVEDVAVCT